MHVKMEQHAKNACCSSGGQSTCSPTRSAWKPSGRCGSATNRTCSEGKRTTPSKEASATSTRPTAAGMCTNPWRKKRRIAVLCDKEPQLLRRKQTHRRNHVSLLPRQKQGPILRRKETNRGLYAGGPDHHDCGVPGRGEGNDGERGDELYVGEILRHIKVWRIKERKQAKVWPELAFCM